MGILTKVRTYYIYERYHQLCKSMVYLRMHIYERAFPGVNLHVTLTDCVFMLVLEAMG